MAAKTLRDLFVNRDRQILAFRKMLDGQTTRRVMVISAPPGMGKSWLLRMFALEANPRALPTVQIDFGDGQAYDALALVRRCRDAFGTEAFNAVTQAINDATTPRLALSAGGPTISMSASGGSTISGSPISVAEISTTIQDNYFVLQTDNPLVRQAAEDRVNQAFFGALQAQSASTRVVFLFATYERASLESERWVSSAADRWVQNELLVRIRDTKLSNVIVVLSGTRAPEFGPEWSEVLGHMELDPLDCVYITEYLRQRRGLSVITDAEAKRLCEATAGIPQVLGLIGDNLEQANRPKAQDEEW